MIVFLRCFIESAGEVGLKGLAGLAPGGDLIYDMCEKTLKKYRAELSPDQQRQDLQQLLPLVDFEQAQAAVEEAAKVLNLVPVGANEPEHAPQDIITLKLFAAGIPEALRQSLIRPDDLTGTTLPYDYALNSEDDVVKILPPCPPQFRVGDTVPGRPNRVLVKLLGTGGFGEVWLVRDVNFSNLRHAVKFFKGKKATDSAQEAILINTAMGEASHPGIVPLADADPSGSVPWLMFEYISGGSLTQEIHRLASLSDEGRLTDGLSIFSAILETVAYCHGLKTPLVHRDLKPSNILKDAQGRWRITDFGIGAVVAKQVLQQESRNGGTRGGRLLTYLRGSHTPMYASSQQRRGDDPCPQDDVHALGVILYQMLMGRPDVEVKADFGKQLRKRKVPQEVIDLIGDCAADDLENRPNCGGSIKYLLLKEHKQTPLGNTDEIHNSSAAYNVTNTIQEMQFDRGYLSSLFINNVKSQTCEFDSPHILILEEKILDVRDLMPLLEKISSKKVPLVIIAEDIESEALSTLVMNKLNDMFQVVCVKAPAYGDRRIAVLEDIAILTGGKAIIKELGIKLTEVKFEDLGRCRAIKIDNEKTIIIGGMGRLSAIENRCKLILEQIGKTNSDYDREKLRERMASLVGAMKSFLTPD
jgi:serine/threonine protein kinase